jgi:hypothetical protein
MLPFQVQLKDRTEVGQGFHCPAVIVDFGYGKAVFFDDLKEFNRIAARLTDAPWPKFRSLFSTGDCFGEVVSFHRKQKAPPPGYQSS